MTGYVPYKAHRKPLEVAAEAAKLRVVAPHRCPAFLAMLLGDAGWLHKPEERLYDEVASHYQFGRTRKDRGKSDVRSIADWEFAIWQNTAWLETLRGRNQAAADWVATPYALGVRSNRVVRDGIFALRLWDIAHLAGGLVADTPYKVLAMAYAQGLQLGGTEDAVERGLEELVHDRRLQQAVLEPWTLTGEFKNIPERLGTRNLLRTYDVHWSSYPDGARVEEQPFVTASVLLNAEVYRGVNGQTLPGPFVRPAFPYYGADDGTIIAPARRSRDDRVVLPTANVGLVLRNALATWPQTVAPFGLDHLTRFDEVYPFVHPSIRKLLGTSLPQNQAHDKRVQEKLCKLEEKGTLAAINELEAVIKQNLG